MAHAETVNRVRLAMTLALGLHWRNTGIKPPDHGERLEHPELAMALQTQQEFTEEEWDALQVLGLHPGHYIESGGCYFTPVAMDTSAFRLSRFPQFVQGVCDELHARPDVPIDEQLQAACSAVHDWGEADNVMHKRTVLQWKMDSVPLAVRQVVIVLGLSMDDVRAGDVPLSLFPEAHAVPNEYRRRPPIQ